MHVTHQPIDHLTWVNSERPEETDDAVTEYSSRERCKHGGRCANFCVVVKLEKEGTLYREAFDKSGHNTYSLYSKIEDGRAAI